MGRKDRALSVEAEDGAVDVWLFLKDTDIVRKITGRKIIGTIDDDVIGSDDLFSILRGEETIVEIDLNIGVDVLDGIPRTVDFFAADIGGSMENLALKVRKIDGVKIHKSDSADARGCQIQGNGGAEAAGADAEDAGSLEPLLALQCDFGHDEMTGVTGDLIVAEFNA